MRYIKMHRGPAAHVLGPPPSRGRDLELEDGVNVSLEHLLGLGLNVVVR